MQQIWTFAAGLLLFVSHNRTEEGGDSRVGCSHSSRTDSSTQQLRGLHGDTAEACVAHSIIGGHH